jgi:phosphotransferase family enzyme
VPPPGAVWGGTPANTGGITAGAELVSHRDYYPGNVVFRDGLPAALIDFDFAKPTTRLYDIANALWYWAPLRNGDPRDRAPAFADADMVHRVAVFADAYGMTAEQRAEFGPFAVDLARRYHEDSRDSAELDPVYRKLWEDGAKDVLPRAEAWLSENAPAITARLTQPDYRRGRDVQVLLRRMTIRRRPHARGASSPGLAAMACPQLAVATSTRARRSAARPG